MQMRQQNGWLLVLSLSQKSWLHVWLVAPWCMCVRLCCLMWLRLPQQSKAIQLPVNWPAPCESVSKTKSITLFLRVAALLSNQTQQTVAPNVPTPHNSAVWNSTNPISAAVVSTACPHSWAYHRPQIRPFWLLGCMPVITPKNMLIPQDSPPSSLLADLWLHHCISVPLKRSMLLKVPLTLESVTEGAQCPQPSSLPCLQHTSSTSCVQELCDGKIQGVYVRSHKKGC